MAVNPIELLYRMGVDEKTIAKELDLPVANVRGAITYRQTSTFLEPEDRELADAMRDLAWRAYREAKILIEFGSPGDRLGLIKTILSRTTSMVGAETTTRYDEMRNEFEEMLTGFHGREPYTWEAEEEIGASPASIEAVDSDEGSYD